MDEVEGAVRLKRVRDQALVEGRAELSLFEKAPAGDRPHPRLRVAFAELRDPAPPSLPEPEPWADAAAFRAWLAAALDDPALDEGLDEPPEHSPRYWRNSIRAGRKTAVLDHARAALEAVDGWSAAEREAARYAIAELGELAYAGVINFDDEDTGTYHSFKHDEPFVHVLEALLEGLPEDGSEAFAILPPEQQESLRRQRAQLTNHLDFLMRHKYALHDIVEADIERSLGGFLIDRETRQVASEDPASEGSPTPRYQLLRIDPAAEHPQAGAWLMRVRGGFALGDGTRVEVADEDVRSVAIPAAKLTFARAPDDPRLRAGVRFDWNNDGWVDEQAIDWIDWAGHCDIKAVLEAVGLTMLKQDPVSEYRSDTGQITELSRSLLLELLSAVCELGSVYSRMDGTGVVVRGIHHFGGARNDSLPDRLQFQGPGQGRHFRWPLSRRQDDFRLIAIRDADGEDLMIDEVFTRHIADDDAVDFLPNPRYLKTVEGDYNLIDASGMQMTFSARISSYDARGRLVHETRRLAIDLRPTATGRTFLGTHVQDAGAREIFRAYLERERPAVVAELWRWELVDGEYREVHDQGRDVVLPLVSPLSVTLSREIRRDDPEAFRALIELALHRGQNICADTDQQAPVWNGVVTRIRAQRIAENPEARVERWRVYFKARFGEAALEYMVRRAADGTPEAYCPTGTDADVPPPDFLWQDLPDIASKGVEDGAWVVNQSMRQRGIVSVKWAPQEQGGWFVEDDHIKNGFELLYAALAGYRFTIVHQNKRYGFTDRAQWQAARARLERLRAGLTFE